MMAVLIGFVPRLDLIFISKLVFGELVIILEKSKVWKKSFTDKYLSVNFDPLEFMIWVFGHARFEGISPV